jgi:cytidine deaminase
LGEVNYFTINNLKELLKMPCAECQRLDQAVQVVYRQIVKAYLRTPTLPIGRSNIQDPGLLKILGQAIETAMTHERLCAEAQALNTEHALTGE